MGWCQGDMRTVHHPKVQFTIPRGFQGLFTLKLYHTVTYKQLTSAHAMLDEELILIQSLT